MKQENTLKSYQNILKFTARVKVLAELQAKCVEKRTNRAFLIWSDAIIPKRGGGGQFKIKIIKKIETSIETLNKIFKQKGCICHSFRCHHTFVRPKGDLC